MNISRIAKTIDASQARIGHSDESTRCQVKDATSQSEVFMLLDLIKDLICFDQVSHSGRSLPPLDYFHNKFQELWTVCQIPDGSLEGSSAPRDTCSQLLPEFRTRTPPFPRLPTLSLVLYQSALSLKETWHSWEWATKRGIKSRGWNSLHRIRDSFSDRLIMNAQKPRPRHGKSSTHCRTLNYLSPRKLKQQQDSDLTHEIY